jgi:hypothetical protein
LGKAVEIIDTSSESIPAGYVYPPDAQQKMEGLINPSILPESIDMFLRYLYYKQQRILKRRRRGSIASAKLDEPWTS